MAQYLIDSHIFVWAIDAPEKLTVEERTLLEDSRTDIAVSVVSFWELSIKLSKGMLRFGTGKSAIGQDYFAKQAAIAGLPVLSINPPESEYIRVLPPIHNDPFDRLIIAQALLYARTIVTRDSVFARYPGVQLFPS